MAKTQINHIDADWKRVKNHCRTTVGKAFTEAEPTHDFKRNLLISEHSPIRLIEIDWSWNGIKSWIATHWSRHKFEKFISTQRDDRVSNVISRDDAPQSVPVRFDGFANAQQLIDAFRKRLCFQAHKETRALAVDFKIVLREQEPELASMLVPNCIYRFGCPEFKPCGHFNSFIDWCDMEGIRLYELLDIDKRYKYYTAYLLNIEFNDALSKKN